MYLPPKNTVTDEDLFTSTKGMNIYMSRLYSRMPFEEFKYMAEWGITFNSWLFAPGIDGNGEAINRDGTFRTFQSESTAGWSESFTLLHDANYLIESLPDYAGKFSAAEYEYYMGQAYFVRAYTFYKLAARFGGIPLATKVLTYPAETSALEIPRSSEEDTWNQVCADFDKAIELLPETSIYKGLVDKYAALGFKAEAMLYAGSVAKYNDTVSGRLTGIGSKSGNRVIGFDESTAAAASVRYFSEAYKAAREVMDSQKYSLYKKKWVEVAKDAEPADKAAAMNAQYQNMVDMFTDISSPENLYIKEYQYPTLTHSIDGYSAPFIFRNPLSSGSCPSLDFVELFDGFERYPDGTIKVTTGNSNTEGEYLMFDSTMDFFANAEPRLRAYIIFPGDEFRQREIEVRLGMYTGPAPVKPLFQDYSYSVSTSNKYQNHPEFGKTLIVSKYSEGSQTLVDLDGDGKGDVNASGENGPFYEPDNNEATLSGFYLRKWLNPDPSCEGGYGKSDQHFILMRYADILLAAAEAGVELSIASAQSPVSGDDMLAVATSAINEIRERAGAVLLEGSLTADNESRDIVRRERRKELAFEHKAKWDIRRWRVQHQEGRNGLWGVQIPDGDRRLGKNAGYRLRGLYPIYSTQAKKYFFDANWQLSREKELIYTPIDYYFEIPSGEVAKSPVIDQQPNR